MGSAFAAAMLPIPFLLLVTRKSACVYMKPLGPWVCQIPALTWACWWVALAVSLTSFALVRAALARLRLERDQLRRLDLVILMSLIVVGIVDCGYLVLTAIVWLLFFSGGQMH